MMRSYLKLLEKIKEQIKNDTSWFFTKLAYSFFWAGMIFVMISQCSAVCPYPVGICKLYSFSILFTPIGKVFLCCTLLAALVMYLLEWNMAVVTFFLFSLSCIIISYHESNGLFARATVYSVIWLAQFIAYCRHHYNRSFDVRYWRVQYCVQAIAAAYTLAGLAKLSASGLGWINSGPLFSLQVIKNYAYLYADTGSLSYLEQAGSIIAQLEKYKVLLTVMLTLSLFLETFCLAATLNKTVRIAFGVGLLFMHIGIALILGIGISVIAKPMVIFFINPFGPAIEKPENTNQ